MFFSLKSTAETCEDLFNKRSSSLNTTKVSDEEGLPLYLINSSEQSGIERFRFIAKAFEQSRPNSNSNNAITINVEIENILNSTGASQTRTHLHLSSRLHESQITSSRPPFLTMQTNIEVKKPMQLAQGNQITEIYKLESTDPKLKIELHLKFEVQDIAGSLIYISDGFESGLIARHSPPPGMNPEWKLQAALIRIEANPQ